MARLHDNHVKALLAAHGVAVFEGAIVGNTGGVSVSLRIDDAARAPALILTFPGAPADEAHRLPICPDAGVDRGELERVLAEVPMEPAQAAGIADAIDGLCGCARDVGAITLDTGPLVTTGDGGASVAGCRLKIDEYAVFRGPALGSEIVREYDGSSDAISLAAWMVDQCDDRGTLSFERLPVGPGARAIGFHALGVGAAAMNMDAIRGAKLCPASVTVTGGRAGAAKIYAAARSTLAQDGLLGYFASGAGVESHDQHHAAYGLAKAFLELNLTVPALVRLGGNGEDRAAEIIEDACASLPGAVEAYKKDHTTAFIAARLGSLVDAAAGAMWIPRSKRIPGYVGDAAALSFPVRFGDGWEGACWLDTAALTPRAVTIIETHAPGVFAFSGAGPAALALSPDEAASRDDDLIAAEVELARAGLPVLYADIPIPGLDSAPADGGRG